jgi:hypothetical protein
MTKKSSLRTKIAAPHKATTNAQKAAKLYGGLSTKPPVAHRTQGSHIAKKK